MKKILCMLAAVAIAIPLLSACTTTGGPVATGADGRYVKPVTFTTVRPAYAGMQVPSGWDLTNNPFSDYMKKELNASFTVTWEDNDYETHLIMDMTSNTLADVFYVETYNTFMQLYQGNALADLKPALDAYENEGRYASSYVKDCYGSYDQDYIFGPVTRNGELLALPSVTGGYQQELLWVRQDWLDALNLPQPKTIDDIETTALAFMNNNTQLGGADYPIGINVNGIHAFDGYRNSYGLDPVANAMGAYPMTWIKNAAGQIVYGSIQPEFKQVLAKVRDWVVNGIVDINSFTQSWSDIWANPALKRTGMWFFPLTWSGTSAQTSFLKRNPGAELSMYAAPLNVNGDGKSNYRGPDPMEGMLCVRKGYGNPEVVLRAFDLYNRMTTDTTYEGYQALQPWRDMGSLNTSWYYLAPLSTFAIRDDRIAVTVGEQVVNYIDNGVLPPAGAESNLYLQEVKNWVDGSNNANDWVTWMFRYCASVKEDDPVFNKMQPAFYGQTPTMVTSWSDLLASEYQMINDILTGVQDINYFDQWVSDWKAAGGDAITNEIANGQY